MDQPLDALWDIEAACKHSQNHASELKASALCGCYQCLGMFAPSAIRRWIGDPQKSSHATAICPKCSVDAVIGDASGFPITFAFLRLLHARAFRTTP
jgi:hypothetical protein